jgi:hypothetical protein
VVQLRQPGRDPVTSMIGRTAQMPRISAQKRVACEPTLAIPAKSR